MPRGGARKPGEGKSIGRPKGQRPTNSNVAMRVLEQARAEQLWLQLIEIERNRLGMNSKDGEAPPNISIIPLVNLLRYLENRAYGDPHVTVNHLHDKPIDLNVNLSMAEIIRDVRQRKQEYERSRK